MNNSLKNTFNSITSIIPITKPSFSKLYPLTRPSSVDSGINDTISSSPETTSLNHNLYRTKLTVCDNNCNNIDTVTYLCHNCSLTICKKCKKRQKYPQTCYGIESSTKTSIFGTKLQNLDTTENIPSFIYNFIKSIEQTNIFRSEGFYRKTGSYKIKSQIKQNLLTISNCSKNSTFPLTNSDMIQDPHIYAQIFKDFFRELPEPILPRKINSELCQISDELDFDVKKTKLRNCLKLNLTRLKAKTFSALIMHLARVSLAKSDNLMSAENLAIIWVQCLLRFEEPTPENIEKLKIENDKIVGLLKFVIEVAAESIRSRNDDKKVINKSSDEISKLDSSFDNREHWMRKQVTPRRAKSLRVASTHL